LLACQGVRNAHVRYPSCGLRGAQT
jgi:hypothetical protein